jgi:hypothetical protein
MSGNNRMGAPAVVLSWSERLLWVGYHGFLYLGQFAMPRRRAVTREQLEVLLALGLPLFRKTNVGCARRACAWRTAEAPDRPTSGRLGSRSGRAVGSLFSLEGVWGYDAGFMALDARRPRSRPKENRRGDVWLASVVRGQIAGGCRARAR